MLKRLYPVLFGWRYTHDSYRRSGSLPCCLRDKALLHWAQNCTNFTEKENSIEGDYGFVWSSLRKLSGCGMGIRVDARQSKRAVDVFNLILLYYLIFASFPLYWCDAFFFLNLFLFWPSRWSFVLLVVKQKLSLISVSLQCLGVKAYLFDTNSITLLHLLAWVLVTITQTEICHRLIPSLNLRKKKNIVCEE